MWQFCCTSLIAIQIHLNNKKEKNLAHTKCLVSHIIWLWPLVTNLILSSHLVIKLTSLLFLCFSPGWDPATADRIQSSGRFWLLWALQPRLWLPSAQSPVPGPKQLREYHSTFLQWAKCPDVRYQNRVSLHFSMHQCMLNVFAYAKTATHPNICCRFFLDSLIMPFKSCICIWLGLDLR